MKCNFQHSNFVPLVLSLTLCLKLIIVKTGISKTQIPHLGPLISVFPYRPLFLLVVFGKVWK